MGLGMGSREECGNGTCAVVWRMRDADGMGEYGEGRARWVGVEVAVL